MTKEGYTKLCAWISGTIYFYLAFYGLPSSPNAREDILLWSGIIFFGTLYLASAFCLLYIIETKKNKRNKEFLK